MSGVTALITWLSAIRNRSLTQSKTCASLTGRWFREASTSPRRNDENAAAAHFVGSALWESRNAVASKPGISRRLRLPGATGPGRRFRWLLDDRSDRRL